MNCRAWTSFGVAEGKDVGSCAEEESWWAKLYRNGWLAGQGRAGRILAKRHKRLSCSQQEKKESLDSQRVGRSNAAIVCLSMKDYEDRYRVETRGLISMQSSKVCRSPIVMVLPWFDRIKATLPVLLLVPVPFVIACGFQALWGIVTCEGTKQGRDVKHTRTSHRTESSCIIGKPIKQIMFQGWWRVQPESMDRGTISSSITYDKFTKWWYSKITAWDCWVYFLTCGKYRWMIF